MAVTVTTTSNYVEGGDKVRRYQITGDTSYPTGGYDIRTPMTSGATPGLAFIAIKRIISVRHRTVASALVGFPVAVDTYQGGQIKTMNLAIIAPGGAGELAAGTSTANLNVEVVTEGY